MPTKGKVVFITGWAHQKVNSYRWYEKAMYLRGSFFGVNDNDVCDTDVSYYPPTHWAEIVPPSEARDPNANYYDDVVPGCSYNYGSALDRHFNPPHGTPKPQNK